MSGSFELATCVNESIQTTTTKDEQDEKINQEGVHRSLAGRHRLMKGEMIIAEENCT
jgi:hypothetical protein